MRSGNLVGAMLATLVNFYNPSLVIIGGVASAGDLYLATIRQNVYRRSLPLATRDLRIVRVVQPGDDRPAGGRVRGPGRAVLPRPAGPVDQRGHRGLPARPQRPGPGLASPPGAAAPGAGPAASRSRHSGDRARPGVLGTRVSVLATGLLGEDLAALWPVWPRRAFIMLPMAPTRARCRRWLRYWPTLTIRLLAQRRSPYVSRRPVGLWNGSGCRYWYPGTGVVQLALASLGCTAAGGRWSTRGCRGQLGEVPGFGRSPGRSGRSRAG